MKNVVFWDVRPCGSYNKQSFGGNYRIHRQGEKNLRANYCERYYLDYFHPDDGHDTLFPNIGVIRR
jgi:hypothetical protein